MPSVILSDNGVSSGSAGLKSTAGNDGVLILQTTTSGGTATNAIYITNDQKIGIGTSTPAEIVHISSASPRLTFTSTNNTSGARYDTVGTATSGSHRFQYNGTEVLTVGISGQTLALQGASPVSGTGISFPATQSASSDANTLDDYEEGTWTPTVVGTGTAGTCTYTTRVGKYTKIGNVVTLMCSLGWSGHTGTGNTLISTLPFTPANYSSNAIWPAAVYASNMNFGTSATALGAFAVEADTTILFRGMINNATRADVTLDSAVDNLVVNVTYYI